MVNCWVLYRDFEYPVEEPVSPQVLSENDRNIAIAYSLMAINGKSQVWAKFAKQEIDALLAYLDVSAPLEIIDMGCGTGRHALDLALRGFKVRAFDYVAKWVDRVKGLSQQHSKDIAAVNGELAADFADARRAPAIQAAPLVLCLYDVLGSSDLHSDALDLVDGLFRLCIPGGTLVLGSMNGSQMIRGLAGDRIIMGEPKLMDLEPVNTMQKSGEVFEFGKMAFNPMTGILYRREQFFDGERLCQDCILKERRFTAAEVAQLLVAAGFEVRQCMTVRAGKWDFSGRFDPDAPELLFVCRRPDAIVASIPRLRPVDPPDSYAGFTLELIPRERISEAHAAIVSRIFCTSFGKNPKTGKMHVLGPSRMFKRLQRCSYLCVVSKGKSVVGYMFGTEYKHLLTSIAWLDSICVLKGFRRQGLATAMLDAFARVVPDFEWLGATSPNPITRLVLEKLQLGKIFGPGEPAPAQIVDSLTYISHECEDLRGCEIDAQKMRIKTSFSVDAGENLWDGAANVQRHRSQSQPAWWTDLANLPEDYESLLIIHRKARHLLEGPTQEGYGKKTGKGG